MFACAIAALGYHGLQVFVCSDRPAIVCLVLLMCCVAVGGVCVDVGDGVDGSFGFSLWYNIDVIVGDVPGIFASAGLGISVGVGVGVCVQAGAGVGEDVGDGVSVSAYAGAVELFLGFPGSVVVLVCSCAVGFLSGLDFVACRVAFRVVAIRCVEPLCMSCALWCGAGRCGVVWLYAVLACTTRVQSQ